MPLKLCSTMNLKAFSGRCWSIRCKLRFVPHCVCPEKKIRVAVNRATDRISGPLDIAVTGP